MLGRTPYDGTGESAPGNDVDSMSLSQSMSRESHSTDIEEILTACGLEHKLEIFHKAASAIQIEPIEANTDLSIAEVEALQLEKKHKWKQPRLLYFTIATCSLGAIEQGWAQTSMNGANLYFPQALGVGSKSTRDVFIVGLINSALYLSVGLWGSWLSVPLNKRLGRRGTIFVGSALCLLGNAGSALSQTWFILLLFRSLLGTGLGINASTVSVFAAECAPAFIRGGLAVSWQMWTAFGIFLGFLANVAVYDFGPDAWRLQLAAPCFPVLPLLAMIYWCPESPSWYAKKHNYQLAFQSLVRLRNAEIVAAKEFYSGQLKRKASSKPSITDFLRQTRLRNATFASYVVMLSQQLCGINIISFYSSTIFSQAGFSTFSALVASCVFGLVNFLGAFPAVWTMDTFGRRASLLWTLPFMAITMFAAGLTFRMPESNVQFVLMATLIYVFCALYSPGMGPVPSAYSAEVFPLSHRELGMSLAVAATNFWAAILSLTFPALLESLGSEGAFELYAAMNLLALVLVFMFVRETKRKTLEELDEVFAIPMLTFIHAEVTECIRYVSQMRLSNLSKLTSRNPNYTKISQDERDEL